MTDRGDRQLLAGEMIMQDTLLPPHGIHSDLLTEQEIGALLDHALAIEGEFRPATVDDLKRDITYKLDVARRRCLDTRNLGAFRAVFEERARALLPSFVAELGVPAFEIAKVELQIVAYGDGSFQKAHIDTAVGAAKLATKRVLTAVYYFHALPKAFSGGALRLYPLMRREPAGKFVDIEPVRNRLVVFPSWARHEVLPVSVPSGQFRDSRFAINCWIHDRQKAVSA